MPQLNFSDFRESVAKIMGKTVIWAIPGSYPLPPLKNVQKQQAKLLSSYVIGSQDCIEREGDF